jgi:hypothetical protein
MRNVQINTHTKRFISNIFVETPTWEYIPFLSPPLITTRLALLTPAPAPHYPKPSTAFHQRKRSLAPAISVLLAKLPLVPRQTGTDAAGQAHQLHRLSNDRADLPAEVWIKEATCPSWASHYPEWGFLWFSSVVRQMPGYTMQSRGTTRIPPTQARRLRLSAWKSRGPSVCDWAGLGSEPRQPTNQSLFLPKLVQGYLGPSLQQDQSRPSARLQIVSVSTFAC